MDRGKSTLNRATGLLLVTLLPVLGASIPVLDISPEDGRTGVESHHHPGTHGLPHNHLICIQQAANQWVQGCAAPLSLLVAETPLPPGPDPTLPTHSNLVPLPDSRAPPLV